MKKVEAIIRAERMPVVKEKLRQTRIGGMTISTVEQAFNITTLDKGEKVIV